MSFPDLNCTIVRKLSCIAWALSELIRGYELLALSNGIGNN